ncbi:MAG: Mrp/NBP35 family ATP-binding protein [Saprospiraceae bacterium]|nr:Mrp/NBP35 family ATP-binding protein [Saprospiraceae bacterium]
MENLDNNRIVNALRTVQDPETGQDLIKTGKIKDFKVEGNNVFFTLSLKSSEASYKSDLTFACIQAIQAIYPEADVNIHSVTDEGSGVLSQIKHVIAVASGKGGVGKSTVSVNLALGLKKKGLKVGLMDADLYGPSIPTMLGVQDTRPTVKKIFGKNKIEPLSAHGLSFISIGNIVDPEQAVVLRGPRLGGIIKQFVQEVLWPDLDVLVIDLPPGTGDIQLTLVQTLSITGAVIVTTPQKVSMIDVVKAANMFALENINVPILGVVENMSWFEPKEMPGQKYHLFGKGAGKALAEKYKTRLLGQIPIVQSVQENADIGQPQVLDESAEISGTFMKIADNFIEQLNKRISELPPTQRVEIKT